MTLDTYLKANRLTETQFANLVGVQQSTINRLKRGSVPSKELMAKIVAVTDGKVRADDFFGLGEVA